MTADHHVFSFPNDIRFVYKQVKNTKVFHCGFMLDVGSRDERPDEQGLAHFWEHMAFKGTRKRKAFHIINRLEKARFTVAGLRMVRLTEKQARTFYAVHEGKPFLNDLVAFMTSGPVVPIHLEKENAVEDLRTLIGATNPEKAACGTIRDEIGRDIEKNSVHASDSDENAKIELAFFFGDKAI